MIDRDGEARLELVRDYVNTLDVESGKDGLRAWLGARGPHGVPASRSALHRARDVREAIRALLVANAGGPPAPDAWQVLDRQAVRSRIGARFNEGRAVLRPDADGADGVLGEVLAAAAACLADGSWGRLRACVADDCRWAFVDRSRNGSRRWCDMRVCGNRVKARAFRARRAGT